MAQTAKTEAEFRTAIGRMYYGLHHETCCRYFRENPSAAPLERGRRHFQLVGRFKVAGNSIGVRISQLLGELSRMRNASDYELAGPVRHGIFRGESSQFVMMHATIVADQLLQALDDYSQGEAEDGCECPSVLTPT